jgi:carboxyl-terminal processing protease
MRTWGAALALLATLSACGSGDDTASSGGGAVVVPLPTPTPTPAPSTCSLAARQSWVLAQFNSWYLFPETVVSVDPGAFSTLESYIDALTATARAEGRDRYFTYVTSIAEEDAYYNSGATAGMGVRLHIDDGARQLFVSEAFEGAPAVAAGIDRGTEILAIGTSAAVLRTVSDIIAAEGSYGVYDALGDSVAGVTRSLRIRDVAGERVVTITKGDYAITPVSADYGVRILTDGGRKIGYLNLRTFITSANAPMRSAFATFRAQGVQDLIVDLRYNGGGLVSVAQVLASLLGGARSSSDIVANLVFRADQSAENESYRFLIEANALAPRRIAFIGTEGTASASELVINAMRPYLQSDVALIGANSYGKPVGQIALDRSACDDRLRLVAFAVNNAHGEGNYFTGMAPLMAASCRAEDDLAHRLGDPAEDSIARALDFIGGRSCTPIAGNAANAGAKASGAATGETPARRPLVPDRPSLPQRELPGLF